jgi:hypothetical protein
MQFASLANYCALKAIDLQANLPSKKGLSGEGERAQRNLSAKQIYQKNNCN